MEFDRPDSVDSSDCSNHSTTTSTTDKSDKDTEPSSDSECKLSDSYKTHSQAMWKNNVSFVTKGTVFASGHSQGSILSPPLFSQNPFAVRRSTTTRSQADSTENRPLLTPSKLSGVQESASMNSISSSSKLVLRPSALADQASKLSTYSQSTSDKNGKTDCDSEAQNEVESCSITDKTENGMLKLNDDSKISKVYEISAGSASFVFGQNIKDRVQNAHPVPEASSSILPTNGSSDLLFTSAMKYADTISEEQSKGEAKTRDKNVTLAESAREYEESKQVKRKYEEVEVITGEENESNVLQMMCKLFTFDNKLGTYQERGRGMLRVNDMQSSDHCLQSRIVMRTQGSLRLILNTLVWPGMQVEKPSPKTVRFTALDNDIMKILLIMGNPKDVDLMYNALHYRVMELKKKDNIPEVSPEGLGDNFPSSSCSPSQSLLDTDDCEITSCKRQCMIPDGNRRPSPMIQRPEVDSSDPTDP